MKILSDNIRFLLLLVLIGIGAISCSEDMEEVNDEVEVTFMATLQDDLLTRAFGEGLFVNRLVIGVFNLNENGEYSEIMALRHYADIINGKIENVTLSLAKSETYHFVFWAYNSDCGVYDIEEEGSLTEIKMKNNIIGFAEAENADAFFATVKNFTVTGNTIKEVELTRPLAQINVGTSGAATAATFTVYETADTFHPFMETVSGEANFTWTFAEPTTETFSVEMNKTPYTYNYLALGYLFAPLGKETEAVKKTCQLELAETDKEIPPFQDVELHANRRSNIVGSFTE